MRAKPLSTAAGALLLLPLALLPATAETAAGQDRSSEPEADEVPDPARLFEQGCQACHQPPDLQFAVDRAWLNQVKDTA